MQSGGTSRAKGDRFATNREVLMSPCTATVTVSSETFLPFSFREVWPRLPETVDAPADAFAREEQRFVRWQPTGTRGWLPVEDPTAEVRLDPADGGTRVSFRLDARSAPEISGLVRRRLQGYADGLLAAFANGVRRAAGRR
jgi:hypothetical protein